MWIAARGAPGRRALTVRKEVLLEVPQAEAINWIRQLCQQPRRLGW